MKTTAIPFFVLFILLLCLKVQSQNTQDTSLVRIETNDGNYFTGEIVGQDSLKVYLKTQNLGEISILKKDIKSQEKLKIQQVKEGKIWFANPQSSRYFWSPNGYGLQQGEGYYQNIWVLWNQFSYGLSDNFSVGAGIIPLFLFGGSPTPVFFTPKISIPIQEDRLNIGAGALLGTVLGESESGFGIVYGISTFGTRDNNVTFGLGYGFAGGEWASSPLININGMFRLSSRGYFITENYFIEAGGDSFVMVSLGGRWIIQKAALDFGLFFPVADIGEFVVLPWLGLTIPFGKTY
ncbi:hypothetical protein GM418_17425 [Maribellus comscasis]|uniref:Uncharacterized protein n=1 Tax=Maribellus comscasis TaxID=2681766 RepID=A0A6I6JVR3_9BACT|nr:hypothetical protein [Maribellus comscasis]QGY45389.1 hypothetical protein GM418_17425 [Maribellus comscasis]